MNEGEEGGIPETQRKKPSLPRVAAFKLRETLFKALCLEMSFHDESFQYSQFLACQRIVIGVFKLKISENM